MQHPNGLIPENALFVKPKLINPAIKKVAIKKKRIS